MSIPNDDYDMDFTDSYELESELAEVLNRYAAKKNSISIPEPNLARRNTIAVTSRKQSVDEFMGYERQREKPAQLKLEKEIEMAQKRANELRILQSVRQLTAIEIEELKKVELEEFEARRKLKRTKDAALRAKRYRIRRAANNDAFSQPVENLFDVGESQSPEVCLKISSNFLT
uniref:C2H2-type domain-containing protein n=1 Tax=Panagrolaimus sp. JU765 TaxID=591449 RepID=A0AC34QXH3_9BILA